jgi:hypothetical protein
VYIDVYLKLLLFISLLTYFVHLILGMDRISGQWADIGVFTRSSTGDIGGAAVRSNWGVIAPPTDNSHRL